MSFSVATTGNKKNNQPIKGVSMAKGKKAKLSLDLTEEQLRALRPLMEATGGQVKIAGTVDGKKLNVSFIACNAAFLACNAAFTKAD